MCLKIALDELWRNHQMYTSKSSMNKECQAFASTGSAAETTHTYTIDIFPYSTLWSKGTEEHNSAAENVWKESPSFYTQAAYVFATNIVIYLLIFSQCV